MIDPRFSNAGAASFVPGYAIQQLPAHRHRHRRHRKNKNNLVAGSPLSRDESIHKVDQSQAQQYQQNGDFQYGSGFGVPFAVGGYAAPNPGVYYPQPPFAGANFGQAQQYAGNAFGQGQVTGNFGGSPTKRHRHHHRHHRSHHGQSLGASNPVDQAQAVPEQLIGQRSSSVLGNELPQGDGGNRGVKESKRRHRHHHHHSGEHSGHQSRRTEVSADGYGHINDELIFIERGEHSPHRQEPPSGYEYKGKIEVKSVDREIQSHFHEPSTTVLPHPVGPIAPPPPAPSAGPCPPGWQQLILSMTPSGPVHTGGTMYSGQVIGGGSLGQGNLGGIGGFGGAAGGVGFSAVPPVGTAGSYPLPGQGQIIADYVVDAVGGQGGSQGGQTSGGYSEYHSTAVTQERVTGRTKIIEVWQKRHQSQPREKSRSRSRSRSRSHERVRERSRERGPSFDFERFRSEILAAIERTVQTSGGKSNWSGHDGGTQTQIHSSHTTHETREVDRTASGGGEVRVIVQPIQPVFYMPRPTESTAGPAPIPHIIPTIQPQQPASGSPKIIYIPRNVYVPVIKPVFVPRERVIVRPQVIHVARPVLVDRPVPVTQRPIIIDRERPIPVPVRGAAQTGGSNVVREEYVYRDNLPVAYGGRCPEVATGINYGYMPTQQEHQYTTSSFNEVTNGFQAEGPVINVTVPNQYQHSQSAANLNVYNAGNYQAGYTDLARTQSASAVQGGILNCSGPIEVLDTTVNSSWQSTDQSSLLNRYGRSALDIVQKTNQVEQQMYHELRGQTSSGGMQRSASAGSFGSGSVAGLGGSYSSIPLGPINNFNPEGIPHQGPAPIPVRINY